jgi:UDP-N-acetylmuramoyl-tripeptide--D-alanyl-D-alanine ligase
LRRFVSRGITVFDDTYNANPESMIAGLRTLAAQEVPAGGRRFAVLGRMGELGEHAAEGGQRVGACAASLPIVTVTVGGEADLISLHAGGDARHFNDREAATHWLSQELRVGDVVLFKGSRTAAMERVMKQIFPED